MRPTDELEHEHRVIEPVAGALERMAERLRAGKDIDRELLDKTVAFMREFADRCHHGKEEAHLFPYLEGKGVPEGGCPLGALRQEHRVGRLLTGTLATHSPGIEKGDAEARTAVANALAELAELYPKHIWKEDNMLFPLCEKLLDEDDMKTLEEAFTGVEEEMGSGTHERYKALADEIVRESA